ncbi:MAG: hypothetical protein CMM25_02955 [Rhodospirillaceae bacterium]|nr:hypothetical protein [Rhodospirillaceae bacterium]
MMLSLFLMTSSLINTLRLPATSMVGEFAVKQVKKYEVNPIDMVCISEDTEPDFIPNIKYDMIVYNTTNIAYLTAAKLDKLLIDTQASLRTLGMLVIVIPTRPLRESKGAYDYILDNPLELWDYNLVSVEVEGRNIAARKGSTGIFKDRGLLKLIPPRVGNKNRIRADNTTETDEEKSPFDMLPFIVIKTGDERTDYVINMLGMFLQYTFLFNFFTFGIMFFMTSFINGGPQ